MSTLKMFEMFLQMSRYKKQGNVQHGVIDKPTDIKSSDARKAYVNSFDE